VLLDGASGGFDAVICDLHLPDESGAELYEWLCGAQPRLAAARQKKADSLQVDRPL